jgi:membrane dipeptidase
MFRAICQTGGVVGMNLYAHFLGENASINTVCDHIIHLLDIDTECKHIALGGDLDGCDLLPEGFAGIQDYPKLADRLLERGLSEEMVENIFWNNAMGVMRNAIHNDPQ